MAEKKPRIAKTEKLDKKGKRDLEAVQQSLHKVWLAGLGAVARAEEEGGKLFKTLVAKGEHYERRGRNQVDRLIDQVEAGAGKAREGAATTYGKLETRIDEVVGSALQRSGVPSREEIATLTRRVEELTRVVEGLKRDKAPSTAGPTPAAKQGGTASAAPAVPSTPAAAAKSSTRRATIARKPAGAPVKKS